MKRNLKRAVHAGFAVVGGGVLAVTYANAYRPATAATFPDDHPNPGLVDGEYVVKNDDGPLRSLTMTVDGGRIVDVRGDYNKHNRKSHSLNSTAVAQLRAEALDEQSADDLDLFTGATVTSGQFVGSLQEAVDLATP